MIYCKQLHTNVTIRAQEHEVVYRSGLVVGLASSII
jgi:hypothetical protein